MIHCSAHVRSRHMLGFFFLQGNSKSHWWSWFGLSGWPLLLCILIHATLAAKTLHRNIEWWDMDQLGLSGLRVNPANAKIHFTIANGLAQKVSLIRRALLPGRSAIPKLPPGVAVVSSNILVVNDMAQQSMISCKVRSTKRAQLNGPDP